jgi:hypothetical protein
MFVIAAPKVVRGTIWELARRAVVFAGNNDAARVNAG